MKPLYCSLPVVALTALTSTSFAKYDLDGDGISDLWVERYNVAEIVEGRDSDGDGHSDMAEAEAGTNPMDGSSTLAVEYIRVEEDAAHFCWKSEPGKHYQLLAAYSLDGDWRPISPLIRSGGERTEHTIPLLVPVVQQGGLLYERFENIGGSSLNQLRAAASFPDSPDHTEVITEFNAPSRIMDSYGVRVRGYIIPPETGTYRFFMTSDDEGELYLSFDGFAENKQLIANVPGWAPSGTFDKYPEQTSEPIELFAAQPYYVEALMKEGGGGDHLVVEWSRDGGPQTPITGNALGEFTGIDPTIEAFDRGRFYQVAVYDLDTDNDGLLDWEEELVSLDPFTTNTANREIDDIQQLEEAMVATPEISVVANVSVAYEKSGEAGEFTLLRRGGIRPVGVYYTITGDAGDGTDFATLTGYAYFEFGQRTLKLRVDPVNDGILEDPESVEIALVPDAAYQLGADVEDIIRIEDAAPVLYLASLRPAVRDGFSTASGFASMLLAGNETQARLALTFTNLNGTPASSEITIADESTSTPITSLPLTQLTDELWVLDDAVDATREEIVDALVAGRLGIRIASTDYSDGELAGTFGLARGNQLFTIPQDPPALPGGLPTAEEAARFLIKATYGPTPESVQRVTEIGYAAWIDEQMALPQTLHLTPLQDREAAGENVYRNHRVEEWWDISLNAPDQLRQRVAFALSEIFVVSDRAGSLSNYPHGLANYYDMLARHAFGNYRDLLEDVTLSPVMGNYLSMIKNQKPDPANNIQPDENYAREVMQLFSIGLLELNPDGSVKLGDNGQPVQTYDNSHVVGFAHVFTGWAYYNHDGEQSFRWGDRDMINPMSMYPEYHDTGPKKLLRGVILTSGRTGEQDLQAAMDNLFYHENVGPFMAKRLIQRLVTSNPSPGYVYRVAQAFEDNGAGVRGDLGAVIKAILLDYEALAPELIQHPAYGKMREPILRVSHAWRVLDAGSPSGRYGYGSPENDLAQAPLRSPSVFNFFEPEYTFPGMIAEAGLLSPEFQITSETTSIDYANTVQRIAFSGISWGDNRVEVDLSEEMGLASDPAALLDHLDLLLLAGQMTPELRADIMNALDAIDSTDTERIAETAVYLVLVSPEFVIQK